MCAGALWFGVVVVLLLLLMTYFFFFSIRFTLLLVSHTVDVIALFTSCQETNKACRQFDALQDERGKNAAVDNLYSKFSTTMLSEAMNKAAMESFLSVLLLLLVVWLFVVCCSILAHNRRIHSVLCKDTNKCGSKLAYMMKLMLLVKKMTYTCKLSRKQRNNLHIRLHPEWCHSDNALQKQKKIVCQQFTTSPHTNQSTVALITYQRRHGYYKNVSAHTAVPYCAHHH